VRATSATLCFKGCCRIQQHNAGKGAAYTRSRRPIELVWTEPDLTESLARKKEHEMKKWRKAAKELFLEKKIRYS
jgi:putative endonuclease